MADSVSFKVDISGIILRYILVLKKKNWLEKERLLNQYLNVITKMMMMMMMMTMMMMMKCQPK